MAHSANSSRPREGSLSSAVMPPPSFRPVAVPRASTYIRSCGTDEISTLHGNVDD
ncbi:hypothetical protein ACFFX0_00885 [Citricoccus parietis]|uniref:Uncharacterized protein n=1 Tax=Citricoccus parietis TaxID=592307 RepID=A0ABV5FT25_9MICC